MSCISCMFFLFLLRLNTVCEGFFTTFHAYPTYHCREQDVQEGCAEGTATNGRPAKVLVKKRWQHHCCNAATATSSPTLL
mmetsp:Transcript_19793/g.37256  ORF Transcript_19793/g.37256 Transcript_19793/m.37256 type:complete len:80 (+) Transcript_19793:1136-1375(+)